MEEVMFVCDKLGKQLKGYNNGDIRNTLFDAAQVCVQLEFTNVSTALTRHVWPQYKRTIRGFTATNGKLKPLLTIGGVMQLIMCSKKPYAVAFQDWVYSELLPNIMFGEKVDARDVLLKQIVNMKKVIEIQSSTISDLTNKIVKRTDEEIKRAKNQEQENYELIDKANNSVMLQLQNGNLF